jgi:uncharacterized protein (DUF1501 family)
MERRNGFTQAQQSRRDFLRTGLATAAGLSLTAWNPVEANSSQETNLILLFLVGGPSQLDTFDPKPDAPSEFRGPFGVTQTRVPGVRISEHFPRLAMMMDRVALIRTLNHQEAPIHETGHQLMQTGRLFTGGHEYPHYGSVAAYLDRQRSSPSDPFALLPAPIGHTGVSVSHGQGAGALGNRFAPWIPDLKAQTELAVTESNALRSRYGGTRFGDSCMMARRLVERGSRVVAVNMFDTVFDKVTWDCHADGGSLASSLDDYRQTLCPAFDCAFTSLIDDLDDRGLLAKTLVVAAGEFGRTPRLNPRGGRDHWPGAWSVLMAGAGIRGGAVVGATDRIAAEPIDRPVTPAEFAATIYRCLGIDPATPIPCGVDGRSVPLVEARPVCELI